MLSLGCGQLEQVTFDDPEDEETGDGSDEGVVSTGGPAESSTGDEPPDGGTTSTGEGPVDQDTDTGESSESDGGSDGAAPTNCWEADPTTWEVDVLDLSELAGGQATGAALSGDGLSLVYVVPGDVGSTAYIAERSRRSDPFVGGEPVGPWATDVEETGNYRFAAALDRLSLVRDGAVHTSDREGDVWADPVLLSFEMPIDVTIGTPSFFDDGLGVMLDLADGPPDAGNPTLIAYEARRDDTSSTMGARTRIAMPGWPDDTPLLCALASPDGQTVIFGGAYPSVWSDPDDTLTSALDIWISQRVDEQTWEAPVEVDALSHDDVLSCPTSVTDDGCQVIIRHWVLGVGTAEFTIGRR